MIRVDLHCHSTHSRHPSEWFLQRLGTQESYTSTEELYRLARARGMTLVTVTDHNTIDGALELVRRHPADTFVSVEITTYFPENGCKVHVLAYDITAAQFVEIQRLRDSIYTLRDYLRAEDIACAVAHPLFSIDGKLDLATCEKLMLLFDVFEGINGGRNKTSNDGWTDAMRRLTPERFQRLARKHGLAPWGARSWIKGFIGGSDDHAGLFVGETCTLCEGTTRGDLTRALREGRTQPAGRHGDYKTVAFGVYKIAYDFYCRQAGPNASRLWQDIHGLLFGGERPNLRQWLVLQKLRWSDDPRHRMLARFFDSLAALRPLRTTGDARFVPELYASVARLADEIFTDIATRLEGALRQRNPGQALHTAVSALPLAFLAAPFLTTLGRLHRDTALLAKIRAFGSTRQPQDKKILWFSDTVLDLNGVSITVQSLAACAAATHRPMQLVTSVPDSEAAALPVNTINLPCLYTVTPDFYTSFTLRIPSLLRALERLAVEAPDEVVISTPGPLGLLGLLLARLTGARCVGIYHTDFTRQVDMFIGDMHVSSLVEMVTLAFYRMMDEVRVPTRAYMDMLAERGIEPGRMKIFRRCIEPGFAVIDDNAQAALRARYGLGHAPVLLWAGRVGQEKNLDFLLDVLRGVLHARPDVRCLLVGDGPELPRLRAAAADAPAIVFAGRVPRTELPHFYGLADVFVFPSTTETFGMVVLETQACGTPALVTNVGGPQELIYHGGTGEVLAVDDPAPWIAAALRVLDFKRRDPAGHAAWRQKIRDTFSNSVGWQGVLDEMLGRQATPKTITRRRVVKAATHTAAAPVPIPEEAAVAV